VPWCSLLLLVASLGLSVGLVFIAASLVLMLGTASYLGVFVLVALGSATIVLPAPTVGVALLAGLASGLVGYAIGAGGSVAVEEWSWYQRVRGWMRGWGPATTFVLAGLPTPLIDVAAIAGGATRLPLWQFVTACTLGKVLRFVAVAWLGHLAGDLGIS
jgi:membrane protein YqaA with SNARE-associated domain